MATTVVTKEDRDDATRLIDSIQSVEQSTLESVRKFVDTVDDAFPDVGEDGVRRRIIDSAFRMTEQLVGASNDFARRVVRLTEDALERTDVHAETQK